MAKLKLVPEPTFSADVPVPMINGSPVTVRMTFRHKKRSDFQEWADRIKDGAPIDCFMEIVVGWDLEEPFNKETASMLLEYYHGAYMATLHTYAETLTQAKLGN